MGTTIDVLDTLAITLDARAVRIRELTCDTVQHICEIGENLIAASAEIGDNEAWKDWLRTEFGWGYWSARNFMNVANKFRIRLGSNTLRLAIDAMALYALAAKATPQEARDEAIAMAQAGAHITLDGAKAVIARHKVVKPRRAPTPRQAPVVEPRRSPQPPTPQPIFQTEEGEEDDTMSPLFQQALALIRLKLQAGLKVSSKGLERENPGISEGTFSRAWLHERARISGVQEGLLMTPIDTSVLSEKERQRFIKLEEKLRAQLERERADMDLELNRRLTEHITEIVLPQYKEKLAQADLVLKRGTVLSNKEYIQLLAALHPDSTNEQRRHEAFAFLKSREIVLRPPEKDKPLSGDLPRTLGELLARKRAMDAAKAQARAQAKASKSPAVMH
jgi:hypothetical protein